MMGVERSRLRSLFERRPVIPALRLAGVIGSMPLRGAGLSLAALEQSIARAFAVRAPAVVLLINSPGGSPVQSALIARRIRVLAQEKGRRVLAFVEDVAASGGYWLALAADEIFVDRASLVGSIGVVSAGFGFERAIDKLGIERRVHTTGRRKALLDPFRPEDPDDLAVLRELQGDIQAAFIEEVRGRRGTKLDETTPDLFEGRVWSGRRAVEIGLVDGLGDARSVVHERFGERAVLRVVNRPRGWWQRRLRVEDMVGEAAHAMLGALEERALWQRFGF